MKLFSVKQLFLILIVIFCGSATGSQLSNPYQGKIVVRQGQEESTLKILALQQVFVKVSGNKEVNHLPGSKLSLKDINAMLAQFSYYKGKKHTYFIANFDEQKINRVLSSLQQPIWGKTRPTTLIWLIKTDQSGRLLVSDSYLQRRADSTLSETIQQEQLARGIPLQFPLMDLEDNLAISLSDVSGRFYNILARASTRYQVANIVSADLRQINATQWQLSWQLFSTSKNKVLLSSVKKGEKAEVIQQMLDAISDYYARQYAILENTDEKFYQRIYIKGINSLTRLTKMHQLLSDMPSISSYQILSVKHNLVSLKVKIKGGLQSFANAFAIQPHLRPMPAESKPFYFDWH
ncbi:hypothetical protein PCNPT3_03985 [Psychromonas sp. CNPT3]|uniref:DUF2066 domain-containing protein n=1 Tax=Psychromonas sp. CNPT3 TaxID=314282 RepID=UPI00006E34AD|nr:DUF2066 domain-containing protein [Psychromonas sp. CNPT3]AGH80739.1 hypothetical protein PCNPT3_03985 [Psychromonas sp. CNPT3]